MPLAKCKGRESWRGKSIVMWSEDIKHKVRKVVVLLVYQYEASNFKELGEKDLGVVVGPDAFLGGQSTTSQKILTT